MCFLFYWIFSYTYYRDTFIFPSSVNMWFDRMKSSLEQIKNIAELVNDVPNSLEALLLWEKNKQEKQQQETIQETKTKQEKLKDNIEVKKMLSVLFQYARELLSDSEINSLDDLFVGKVGEDFIGEYLQEQEYIRKQEQQGNLIPKQALQKAFDLYDPTTNLQAVLEEISDYYFLQQGTQKYEKVHQHFTQLLSEKDTVIKKKDEFQNHTESTRRTLYPNDDLNRYYNEQEAEKSTGLAYDINTEQDQNMKTPQHILNRFVSSWYSTNPITWVTLCARTTRLDAERLFHLSLPQGNAFDVMRNEQGNFKKSLVSQLYNKKEKSSVKVDVVAPNWNLGKSDYINKIAPEHTNVADLFVTSSTKNGKKYWHRALMFRIAHQWHVLDPYTAIQPWEDKNKPRTLESYTKSMQTGRNKREFMRINFYEAPVNLEVNAIA